MNQKLNNQIEIDQTRDFDLRNLNFAKAEYRYLGLVQMYRTLQDEFEALRAKFKELEHEINQNRPT